MTAPTFAAPSATAEPRRIEPTLGRHAGFARLRAAGRRIYQALEQYGEIRAIRALRLQDPALAQRLINERAARRSSGGPGVEPR